MGPIFQAPKHKAPEMGRRWMACEAGAVSQALAIGCAVAFFLGGARREEMVTYIYFYAAGRDVVSITCCFSMALVSALLLLESS